VALPVFTVGQVLTAADTNQYLVNTIVARKTATETVASSTTLQDDDHLTVSVAANCTYELTGVIKYDGATTGDLKFQFVGPSGATMDIVVQSYQVGGTVAASDQSAGLAISTPLSVGAAGTGSDVLLSFIGIVVVSSTAGTFKLMWAQDTSSATGTRVFANSYICLRQIL